MRNEIYPEDEFFAAAYRKQMETPSPEAWDNIVAKLPSTGLTGKKMHISWKAAILLAALLFSVYVFQEWKKFPGQTGSKFTSSGMPDVMNKPETPALAIQVDEGPGRTQRKMPIQTEPDHVNKNGRLFEWDERSENTRPGIYEQQFVTMEKNDLSVHSDDIRLSLASEIPGMQADFFDRQLNMFTNAPRPTGFNSVINPPMNIKSSGKSLWSLSGNLSVEMANYKLDCDWPTAKNIKQSELLEPSYSASIFLTRQMSKHWAIQTGLSYTRTEIEIDPQTLFATLGPAGNIQYKYTTSSGYALIKPSFEPFPSLGDSLEVMDASHRMQSISIPFMVKWTKAGAKFSIMPGAGLDARLIIDAEVETEIKDPNHKESVFIDRLSGLRPFYVSLLLDAEMRYKVGRNVSLHCRPAFRYALSPITRNQSFETFPYSLGVGLGITYQFSN